MRFIFGMVAAMGLLGCGGADVDDASRLESIGSVGEEIVGGVVSASGQAPWQVSLRRSSHFCGGVIYSPRTVITAAHCVSGATPSGMSVRYNSLNHASGGTLVAVSSIVVHPSYSASTIDNDIALVILAAPMTLGQTQARAALLPARGSDPTAGAGALVSGWGTTSEGGSIPAALRSAIVPIVSRASARTAYGASSITDNMIAAGLSAGGVDACQGDSGGPLVINGTLVGITSWGRGCARANYPGIYTRVGNYVDWITANAL
ncbi:serine protease [Stigmatella sp. ncwal1]|uniref:Serine protease n=1 Tax=Stigmatella ashevillensis TaxID=2995309 RepID=A0ABT5DFR9_9BACT|nr:serine protease [Stigmatella ashevillena]MDC0712356.1 serine protease [Stigmatella ashevillena]